VKSSPRLFAARNALAAGLLLVAGLSVAEDRILDALRPAPDRILVLKSERKLFLMAGEDVLKSMDISLGLMPEGPKRREGDFRTPEGVYRIESKNSASDFFLSLKVSYPSAEDRARARSMSVDPGGQIMIHGLPNAPRYDENMYLGWDWTDGCIAVSNSDMVDLWRLTRVSMPIEIRP
jgi:murein L,D-transpeptidase YafK